MWCVYGDSAGGQVSVSMCQGSEVDPTPPQSYLHHLSVSVLLLFILRGTACAPYLPSPPETASHLSFKYTQTYMSHIVAAPFTRFIKGRDLRFWTWRKMSYTSGEMETEEWTCPEEGRMEKGSSPTLHPAWVTQAPGPPIWAFKDCVNLVCTSYFLFGGRKKDFEREVNVYISSQRTSLHGWMMGQHRVIVT